MSKMVFTPDHSGYGLAHAGETHDSIEEDIRHKEGVEDSSSESREAVSTEPVVTDDGSFTPPVIHSEFVTALFIVLITVSSFTILSFFNVSFFARYLFSMLMLIVLGGLYIFTAPWVTAILVGLGFLVFFSFTIVAIGSN